MSKSTETETREAEKRSVHTDALATLGTIITAGEKRDAIHLAVYPAIAGTKLFAGQDIGFNNLREAVPDAEQLLGIVDPFLKTPVQYGQRFWLIVYPRQITSLRHVWEHDKFPASGEIAIGSTSIRPVLDAAVEKALRHENNELRDRVEQLESETAAYGSKQVANTPDIIRSPDESRLLKAAVQSITSFAKSIDSSYDEVMMHAANYVKHGSHWSEGSRFEGQGLPEKFWDHYQVITGSRPEDDWDFFSCSC